MIKCIKIIRNLATPAATPIGIIGSYRLINRINPGDDYNVVGALIIDKGCQGLIGADAGSDFVKIAVFIGIRIAGRTSLRIIES